MNCSRASFYTSSTHQNTLSIQSLNGLTYISQVLKVTPGPPYLSLSGIQPPFPFMMKETQNITFELHTLSSIHLLLSHCNIV